MILVLTNADTEILALRSVVEGLPDGFPRVRAANPNHLDAAPDLDGVDVVLVRLLGGRRAWEVPFDELALRCARVRVPLLAFGGEAQPDAELTAASTVASATVAQAFEYLVHGGLANIEHLLRFVADTVLMGGFGFDAPVVLPAQGILGDRPPTASSDGQSLSAGQARSPVIGVVFYRAHVLSGNVGFVEDLCAAIEARGATAVPVWCYSLRPDADGRVPALELLAERSVDVVVTTVLAMGSARDDDWDASALAALGVPVLQAVAATQPRASWEE
ncbi:MAG: cobaltochelatase subunit CobN, partial [Actinomycetota bacterium]|nr:cobaltochelatase subunit CobN [Actinomycetota bacterium]